MATTTPAATSSRPGRFTRRSFAAMTTRRVLLAALGGVLIVAGFVLMATSDGRPDRLLAVLVLFGGLALVLFPTARPSREALSCYWRRYEKK